MSVILSLFQPIADVVHWAAGPLETLVLLAAAEMPVKTDRSSSLRGSWYLSPRQHAMELVFFNVVAISLSRYFVKEALRTSPSLSAFMSRHRRPAQAWSFKWLIDRSIFMSLVVTFAATVVYKINKNAILFMLQPCHMNVMVYMYLFSPWTNSNLSKIPHLIFNIILHQSWGVLMAIAQPDLRDTTQFLEKEFFWFEHYVLLAIPAYCIWTERFHLIPLNKALAMASFFILAAYHSLLLSTVSLVTATNLNYLLAPPVGILEHFGIYYRLVMYAACLPITFMTRHVLWHAFDVFLAKAKGLFRPSSTKKALNGDTGYSAEILASKRL